jgi:hypothetical protein
MIVMRRFLAAFLGAALVLPTVGGAQAQDYPNRIVLTVFSPTASTGLTVAISQV